MHMVEYKIATLYYNYVFMCLSLEVRHQTFLTQCLAHGFHNIACESDENIK